jgi:hypothetical protein
MVTIERIKTFQYQNYRAYFSPYMFRFRLTMSGEPFYFSDAGRAGIYGHRLVKY